MASVFVHTCRPVHTPGSIHHELYYTNYAVSLLSSNEISSVISIVFVVATYSDDITDICHGQFEVATIVKYWYVHV